MTIKYSQGIIVEGRLIDVLIEKSKRKELLALAKPPLTPIKIKKSNDSEELVEMDYFVFLARTVNPIVNKYDMALNFAGWQETKLNYSNLSDGNYTLAWKVMEEMNLWADYFSSCANLVQKLFLDSETDKIEMQAIASAEADTVKVANGNRLADKDKRVINARKDRNGLKALYEDLQAKVKFCERCHYQAKSMYDLYTRFVLQNTEKAKTS